MKAWLMELAWHIESGDTLAAVGVAFMLGGLVLCMWGVTDARRDVQALRESGINGDVLLLARTRMRGEWVRVLILLLLILMESASFVLPPVGRDMHEVAITVLATRHLTRLALAGIVVVEMILTMRDRASLKAYIHGTLHPRSPMPPTP